MNNYSGLKITNLQTFLLNFIIGVSIVHIGVYTMNVLQQAGVVNSLYTMLAVIGIVLASVVMAKKVLSRSHQFGRV